MIDSLNPHNLKLARSRDTGSELPLNLQMQHDAQTFIPFPCGAPNTNIEFVSIGTQSLEMPSD
jgi:hypothetical protein